MTLSDDAQNMAVTIAKDIMILVHLKTLNLLETGSHKNLLVILFFILLMSKWDKVTKIETLMTERKKLFMKHRATFYLKTTFPWIIAKNLTLL